MTCASQAGEPVLSLDSLLVALPAELVDNALPVVACSPELPPDASVVSVPVGVNPVEEVLLPGGRVVTAEPLDAPVVSAVIVAGSLPLGL